MIDHAQESRAKFIASVSDDPYLIKREAAINWLRERGNYVLDAGSRKYTPAYGGPQDMVPTAVTL